MSGRWDRTLNRFYHARQLNPGTVNMHTDTTDTQAHAHIYTLEHARTCMCKKNNVLFSIVCHL